MGRLLIFDASSLHRCGPYGFISRFTFRQDCAMCRQHQAGRIALARASAVRVRHWLSPLTCAAKRRGAAGIIDGGIK